jgi:hypothetical protein
MLHRRQQYRVQNERKDFVRVKELFRVLLWFIEIHCSRLTNVNVKAGRRAVVLEMCPNTLILGDLRIC